MNILTFDIEDWFHLLNHPATKGEAEWKGYSPRIEENTARILAALDQRGLRATFFCLGWVARNHPGVIHSIDRSGHEIACHSDLHQTATSQSKNEFEEDLRKSLQSLEDVTGKRVRAYRAPGFSVTRENLWIYDLLIENGIEVDCSLFPGKRSTGGLPGAPKEPAVLKRDHGTIRLFPMSAASILKRPIVFSGGAYFRVLPQWLIQRLMRRSHYVMTYFHPRDFDADQPVIQSLPRHRKVISYFGLRNAFRKFESLLDCNRFVSLEQAEKAIDWSKAPLLELKRCKR